MVANKVLGPKDYTFYSNETKPDMLEINSPVGRPSIFEPEKIEL